MKRKFQVEMTCTVTVEVDDSVASNHYHGETVLTAHENRDRFVEGATRDDALMLLAIAGIEGRWPNTDGWADFPQQAAAFGWPEWSLNAVYDAGDAS